MPRTGFTAKADPLALPRSKFPYGQAGLSCPADLLRAIVNSAAEGVIAVSPKGDLLFYNAGARRILGTGFVHHSSHKIAETVGIYRPDGATLWAEPDLPLLRAMKGEKLNGVEMVVRNRRHPRGMVVRVNARPIKDRRGRMLGGIIVFRDVTDAKRLEKELIESRQRLRSLALRIESAREHEKVRIARELHDELGQTLTALKFDAALLARGLMNGRPARALARWAQSVLRLANSGIEMVQSVCGELRSVLLEEVGLLPAIEMHVADFQARTGIRCEINRRAEDVELSGESSIGVFRIVQEALTNVARHSGASRVRITIRGGGSDLTMGIRDNGRGVTSQQMAAYSSLGLLGMRERAAAMGGEVTISGRAGKGTSVVLRLPAKGEPV